MRSPSEGASFLGVGWILWISWLIVCGFWAILSQVSIVSWRDNAVFLGEDGFLSFLEEKTIDARLNFRGPISSPVKVCYVNVDTESVTALGNFPWSRAIFAQALNALFERGKVRAVGMDFVFSDAGIPQLGHDEAEAGSLELGRSINKYRNVIVAATYGTQVDVGELGKKRAFPLIFDKSYSPENTDLPELPTYPVVGPTWGHVGLIDTLGEKARWVPFFARTEHKTYFPMALGLFLLTKGLEESAVEIQPDRIEIRDPTSGLVLKIPLVQGQMVEPNWFLPWNSEENPRVGIASLLELDRMAREGSSEEKARAEKFFHELQDSVILIGPTDPLFHDISVFPMSGPHPVPRVSLHGNLFKTLDSGRFISRPPVWANILLICGLGFGTAWLGVIPHRFSKGSKLLAVLLFTGYAGGAFLIFSKAEILLPLVAPLGAALSCTFVALLRQLTVEERQRRRIKNLFGSYVSAAVVEEMVERSSPPRTGGEEVEITAFFSDIVSFSPLAENLSPKDLVELMCQYLGECTSAVIGEQGTLDKYVGDAIIAMFGAPLACQDHAAAACRAALALQETQTILRGRWLQEARWTDAVVNMQTRVGLHTGQAIVGNIGSELRFNYTMMGDTVNLAQRVEAAAAHYGVNILVSGDTAQAASQADPALVFRAVDRVLVPGRHQAVELHQLLGRGDECRNFNRLRMAAYEEARSIYIRGLWADAREGFLRAVSAEPFPSKKNPASVMLARCDRMLNLAPVDNLAYALAKESNSI
ncbi:MAG: CHASE2 domain-containing protein [Terrimicrobiaceae bacterium]